MRRAKTRTHVGEETDGRACSIYERTRPTKSSSTTGGGGESLVQYVLSCCVRAPYPVLVELPIRETVQWVSAHTGRVELVQYSL